MKSSLALVAFSLASAVRSLQIAQPLFPARTSGFSGPVNQSYSTGTQSACVAGKIAVTVNSTNVKILYSEPKNQFVVTELFQEFTEINSTLVAKSIGESNVLQATYNIDATLCFPVNQPEANKITAVQVLAHGAGLDKSYWDIAPGYSYVDAAVSNGYATLAFNRLGCGLSDHPDPIQVVQSPMDVEIQHGLVQLLRAGKLGGLKPKHVVTVGHSYGSAIQQGQNAKYPQDADAVVLTGFASQFIYLGTTFMANNPAIAALNDPSRFAGLPYAYLVHNDAISFQSPYYRFPHFDPSIFNKQLAAKSTYTIGQMFTNAGLFTPAPNFTGPVDVTLGQHDYAFCLGMCDMELAAETIKVMYPAASSKSQTYIVPNSGHCINAHYSAQQAFDHVAEFLRTNGI